jgi:hypothetical protein
MVLEWAELLGGMWGECGVRMAMATRTTPPSVCVCV